MDQIADEPEDQDFMLNCSATNSVIEEQLEVISNKIKLYETKFKNKTLKFGGYEEMEAHLNPEKIENFKKELSNDLKRVNNYVYNFGKKTELELEIINFRNCPKPLPWKILWPLKKS